MWGVVMKKKKRDKRLKGPAATPGQTETPGRPSLDEMDQAKTWAEELDDEAGEETEERPQEGEQPGQPEAEGRTGEPEAEESEPDATLGDPENEDNLERVAAELPLSQGALLESPLAGAEADAGLIPPGEESVADAQGTEAAAVEKPKRKKHRRSRPKRHLLRKTLLTMASLFLMALVGAFFYFDVPHWQRVDLTKITAAPKTGSLFDNNGTLVTTIKGSQNRVPVSLSDIPRQIQDVFLAAEDLRFYQHHGVDLIRFAGAVVANLKQGSYAQGGSTITMQLIRQSHLSTQKTVARKLEEIYLALMMEQQLSKDQIMEMYLNYIYFGNGAYGIQAAAETYFGVDAKDLTLLQAASLAASIKATSYYSPHISAENNRSRRTYILDTMLAQGMIDQEAHDEAVKGELVLAEAPPPDLPYGWFVDAVLDEAEQLLGLSSEQVLTGGFHIDSTLSRAHQDLLDKQFQTDVFPAKAKDGTLVQGAAAVVNTQTGAVLAIVGGRKYEVRRGLNRATQLRRQPGSAFKPLMVYAPAIDQFGYMTASVLKDEPTNFRGYKPRNSGYAYYGNVSIRTALTNSLNVAAVSLLDKIGVQAGKNYVQKVGIPLDAKDDNLSMALGALTYGVSPVQMAAAYAPFGNGGTFNSSHFITKITDSQGRVLYQRRDTGTRVLKAQSAYLMTSLLSSVTSSGTGAKLAGAGTPVAGKTGTVNISGGGNRDIWMCCYNTDISCAFWMGFDQTDSKHQLQSWVSGGDNTALMARNYFQKLYSGKKKPQFSRPDGIVALEIDKQAIKWRGEPMLAVNLTPAGYRYTEYFTANNHPTKYSDVWVPPKTPSKFTVGHSDKGFPLLIIQPADTAVYRVQRDAIGESFILTELYGTAGETLYYTDTKARAGVVYTYRVIPVHAELLNNGIVLEGMQAVQVAQAKLAGSNSVLDRITDFLFGGESGDAGNPGAASYAPVQGSGDQEVTENTSSIFWSD